MTAQRSLQLWAVGLLGLFYISMQCDARAVNVSNTWTMPQEGLNVFYRFFRDRISWFEADAVCQFHHANLVTVDNSFQFDATRDLLRELDVNDIVWIGLMRPQNSERFMWSNSRPLVTDTGYWAESLPLMEAPLCAVIDPIRDYRWHALRCGGPETASFLCEMPVPSWADSCILKDMPNLTMQYMADTASIELIRNCEEEGLLRQTCKGKQDREHAIRELICPRERLEAQRINDITNSHFKSLQIINSIRTDNNENNDIELLPLGQSFESSNDFSSQVKTEQNPVQRLIEQFSVDELMQADESAKNSGGGFHIPGEIPKPVKKSAKKVVAPSEYTKKESKSQKYARPPQPKPMKQQKLALDDMMMGDQPHGEPEMVEHVQSDEVSNEILEPLPHKKKILPQDLKTMATITEGPVVTAPHTESVRHDDMQQPKSQQDAADEPESMSEEHMKITAPLAPHIPTHVDSTAQPTRTTTTTTTTMAVTTPSTATGGITTTTSGVKIAVSAEEAADTEMAAESTGTSELLTHTTEHDHGSMLHATASVPPATIGHPMHPQQQRSNVITEETQHAHIKESADNSHFIPPMLLVKSHYVPPLKHEHDHDHAHSEHHAEHVEMVEHLTSTPSAGASTTTTTELDMTSAKERKREEETPVDQLTTLGGEQAIDESDVLPVELAKTTERSAKIIESKTQLLNAVFGTEPSANQAADSNNKTQLPDDINTPTTTTIATTMAGARVSVSLELLTTTTVKLDEVSQTTTTTPAAVEKTTVTMGTTRKAEAVNSETTVRADTVEGTEQVEAAETRQIQTETSAEQDKQDVTVMTTEAPATTTTPTTTTITTTAAAITTTAALATTTPKANPATAAPARTITTTEATTTAERKTSRPTHPAAAVAAINDDASSSSEEALAPTPTHNFLNEDTEAPFKPNRRRSLTKPETVSYFKKILG